MTLSEDYLSRLFPINRSLTGDGVRMTYQILREIADFEVLEIPTGTEFLGWTVPDEWNVYEAWIKRDGETIVDFKDHNLHLMGYSEPVARKLKYAKLKPHLHNIFNSHSIPYRTSYYKRDWGFCVRDFRDFDDDGVYEVVVDADLSPGWMTLGKATVGHGGRNYWLTTYSCHPSMANDNVSGMVLWAMLLKELRQRKLRNTYHFLIGPETLGALFFLDRMQPPDGGFAIATVGGYGKHTYKKTFSGLSEIDLAMEVAFLEHDVEPRPFSPAGSDERQFASPGVRAPFGGIYKGKFYEYREYHTSADDLGVISVGGIQSTMDLYMTAIDVLESQAYRSHHPVGEPKLSDYGLYPTTSGDNHRPDELMAMRWVLHGAGSTLPDMALESGIPLRVLQDAFRKLERAGLVEWYS